MVQCNYTKDLNGANCATGTGCDFSSDTSNGTGVFYNYGSPWWSQDISFMEWYAPTGTKYITHDLFTYNGNEYLPTFAWTDNGQSYNFPRWIGLVVNKTNDPIWYYRGITIQKDYEIQLHTN